MTEKELIKIWKSSPQQEQVKFEKSRLMIDVQSNLNRFHKATKRLYLRETISAGLVIPIFTIYAFISPYTLTSIAFILIALWAVYLLFVIKKTKKQQPTEYGVNYLEYLYQTKAYLEEQIRLRKSILTWYILPYTTLIFLAMLGMVIDEPNLMEYIIKMGVSCSVIGTIIYLLNKRSAKKFIKPKLNKVNDLIKTLEE